SDTGGGVFEREPDVATAEGDPADLALDNNALEAGGQQVVNAGVQLQHRERLDRVLRLDHQLLHRLGQARVAPVEGMFHRPPQRIGLRGLVGEYAYQGCPDRQSSVEIRTRAPVVS